MLWLPGLDRKFRMWRILMNGMLWTYIHLNVMVVPFVTFIVGGEYWSSPPGVPSGTPTMITCQKVNNFSARERTGVQEAHTFWAETNATKSKAVNVARIILEFVQ
jgi:hypothetical protein